VKELGYAGECSYNQILYPTEAQTRQLVNWIMLKLPRAEVRPLTYIYIYYICMRNNIYFTSRNTLPPHGGMY
jgi:hypothetical protein